MNFFCIFLQTIHSAACFQLPWNYQRCFRKQHCQNLVPLVMNTGWQQGVNHGKDNALLEQAWFDSSRRMTLLDYYHVSSAALSCSFCSVSGALRGFSQWIPIDFFWSCHQIVCGLNRDYRFLICSLRFLTFYPIWLGKTTQKTSRVNTGLKLGNGSKHNEQTCCVSHWQMNFQEIQWMLILNLFFPLLWTLD